MHSEENLDRRNRDSENEKDKNVDKVIERIKNRKVQTTENAFVKVIPKTQFEIVADIKENSFFKRGLKYCLLGWYKFRSICFNIVKSPNFDVLSLLVICVNTIFMMTDDPTTDSALNDQTETVFLTIYSTELTLKLIGLGFWSSDHAFFKDFWNILDFTIVMSSVLNIVLSNAKINFSGLRSLRVLRPLRTISAIKKLKILIQTIFSSIPFLIDTLFVLVFVIFAFALAGLNFFMGVLKRRCVDPTTLQPIGDSDYCSDDASCDNGFVCVDGFTNPNYGLIHFDNIGNALLMVYQITTMEGWFTIMGYLMTSFTTLFAGITIVYFILQIFIVSFFMMNLLMAVIIVKFKEAQMIKADLNSTIVHHANCLCHTGLNFQQMKTCGLLFNVSQLKKYNNLNNSSSGQKDGWYLLKKTGFSTFGDNPMQYFQTNSPILGKLGYSPMFDKIKEPVDQELEKTRKSVRKEIQKSKEPKKNTLIEQSLLQKDELFKNSIQRVIAQSRVLKSMFFNNHQSSELENFKFPKIMNKASVDTKRSKILTGSRFRQNELISQVSEDSFEDENSPKLSHFLKDKIDDMSSSRFIHSMDPRSSNLIHLSDSPQNKNDQTESMPPVITEDQLKDIEVEFQSGLKPDQTFKSYVDSLNVTNNNFQVHLNKNFKPRMSVTESRRSRNSATENSLPLAQHKNSLFQLVNMQTRNVASKKQKEEEQEPMELFEKSIIGKRLNDYNKLPTSHLKVSLHMCEDSKRNFFKEMTNNILPSILEKTKHDEIQRHKEAFKKLNLRNLYVLATITKTKKEINKNRSLSTTSFHMESSNSGSRSYSMKAPSISSFVNFDSQSISMLKFTKNALSQDISKTLKDYFYLKTCKENLVKVSQTSQSDNTEKIKVKRIRVNNSKKYKLNLKNFYLISKFFEEEFVKPKENEFDFDKIFALNYNAMFYQQIIERDIEKNIIDNSNWSGYDVLRPEEFPIEKITCFTEKANKETLEIWLRGINGRLTIFRRMVRNFHESTPIESFFLLLVLINSVILSLNGLIDSDSAFISSVNDSITIMFAFESFTKILGYGLVQFSKDFFNVFDALVVSISLMEFFFQSGQASVFSAIKVMRILRAVRILRITRLLRSLKFMKLIVEVLTSVMEQFIYIALLLFLFIIIFSLIGMQLFGGQFNFYQKGEIPRQSFDSFQDALIAIFQVMTIENWNDVLSLAYRSTQNFLLGALYLISWQFIGTNILLNLYLAILLDGFSSHALDQQMREFETEYEVVDKRISLEYKKQKQEFDESRKKKETQASIAEINDKKTQEIDLKVEHLRQLVLFTKNNNEDVEIEEDKSVSHYFNQDLGSLSSSGEDLSKYLKKKDKKLIRYEKITKQIVCAETFFFLKKTNWLRRTTILIVSHPLFDKIVMTLIFLSSLKLAIETYSNDLPDSIINIINKLDYFFNVSFFVECLLKVISYGFFFCKNSYLTDSWNRLDFIIVVASTADILLENLNLQFIKILRLLRVLRPLRFLSSNQNLRIVVSSLIESVTGIVNVMIFILVIWIMYGILGINLLQGKLGYCSFPKNSTMSSYGVSQANCTALNGEWLIHDNNFENIINALISLFVLSDGEGWNNYMFSYMDADDPSNGPTRFVNYYIYIYILLFMLISHMFLMDLFVGVIFFQFQQEQEKENKKSFRMVTDDQASWILMQRLIQKAKPGFDIPMPPKSKFRLKFFEMVTSNAFESFVLVAIFLNIIAMSIIYDGMSDLYSQIIDSFNLFFNCLFIVEMILKLIALGWRQYFMVSWNRFDFTLSMMSIIDLFLANLSNIKSLKIYPQLARILKILRVTRLFKIMKSKKFEGIKMIIRTLVFAFPALINVLMLLLLIYFLYSILGCFLFNDAKIPYFQNFGVALLYLFRFSTGEDWPSNMYLCSDNNQITGPIYFISFEFFSNLIMLNMFVLIVVEQFESLYFNPNNPINSFEEISEELKKVWVIFTYKYNCEKIRGSDVYNFFICLKAPLGFHIPPKGETENAYGVDFSINYFISSLSFDSNFVRRKIGEMNLIEDDRGFVTFNQILHAAMKNAFGIKCMTDTTKHIYKQIRAAELETTSKILRAAHKDKSNLAINQELKIESIKFANPLASLLFSQLVFQVWYNEAKKSLKEYTSSSEEIDTILNANPDYNFDKLIMNSMTASEANQRFMNNISIKISSPEKEK
jgi:hypothetical protein